MSIANEELTAIRERAEAASAGPWVVEDDDGYSHAVIVDEPGFGTMYVCQDLSQGHDDGLNDAEFIAHAREDVPALLDHAAELQARLDKVRAVRDYIDGRKDWPAPRWVLLEKLGHALDGSDQ